MDEIYHSRHILTIRTRFGKWKEKDDMKWDTAGEEISRKFWLYLVFTARRII